MAKTIPEIVAEARRQGMSYGKYVATVGVQDDEPRCTAAAPATPERFCPVCGRALPADCRNQKYCSPTCRSAARSRYVMEWRRKNADSMR